MFSAGEQLGLQCDYSNQDHLTKFSINLTSKYRRG